MKRYAALFLFLVLTFSAAAARADQYFPKRTPVPDVSAMEAPGKALAEGYEAEDAVAWADAFVLSPLVGWDLEDARLWTEPDTTWQGWEPVSIVHYSFPGDLRQDPNGRSLGRMNRDGCLAIRPDGTLRNFQLDWKRDSYVGLIDLEIDEEDLAIDGEGLPRDEDYPAWEQALFAFMQKWEEFAEPAAVPHMIGLQLTNIKFLLDEEQDIELLILEYKLEMDDGFDHDPYLVVQAAPEFRVLQYGECVG
ncbi:MAG: hypothetical protein K5919_07840 [Clostridiales bacterium]|nr:hypothetical protein [Clostridiales bacterium]